MELFHLKNKFFLTVNQDEALALIKSLTHQLQTWSPNSERYESTRCSYVEGNEEAVGGCYFSVAIDHSPVRLPKWFRDKLRNHLIEEPLRHGEAPSDEIRDLVDGRRLSTGEV